MRCLENHNACWMASFRTTLRWIVGRLTRSPKTLAILVIHVSLLVGWHCRNGKGEKSLSLNTLGGRERLRTGCKMTELLSLVFAHCPRPLYTSCLWVYSCPPLLYFQVKFRVVALAERGLVENRGIIMLLNTLASAATQIQHASDAHTPHSRFHVL